jgi:hypothetical protein
MKYKKLGKLPLTTVEFFKSELLRRADPDINYQWIQFDDYLNNKFAEIFCNTDLKIQYDPGKNRLVQKAFYSAPDNGFRIHRDGLRCQSALNIAISCNSSDWVRWYDSDYIDSISKTTAADTALGKSRNVEIMNYEEISYVDELRNEVGDVYALDVDSYHSFKCNGPEPRIVIQTKFQGYPVLEKILESLEKNSFVNLIR